MYVGRDGLKQKRSQYPSTAYMRRGKGVSESCEESFGFYDNCFRLSEVSDFEKCAHCT